MGEKAKPMQSIQEEKALSEPPQVPPFLRLTSQSSLRNMWLRAAGWGNSLDAHAREDVHGRSLLRISRRCGMGLLSWLKTPSGHKHTKQNKIKHFGFGKKYMHKQGKPCILEENPFFWSISLLPSTDRALVCVCEERRIQLQSHNVGNTK